MVDMEKNHIRESNLWVKLSGKRGSGRGKRGFLPLAGQITKSSLWERENERSTNSEGEGNGGDQVKGEGTRPHGEKSGTFKVWE